MKMGDAAEVVHDVPRALQQQRRRLEWPAWWLGMQASMDIHEYIYKLLDHFRPGAC